jgi:hypothetical protein
MIHDARMSVTVERHYPAESKQRNDGHVLLFQDILVFFMENKKAVRKREKAAIALQGTTPEKKENFI